MVTYRPDELVPDTQFIDGGFDIIPGSNKSKVQAQQSWATLILYVTTLFPTRGPGA